MTNPSIYFPRLNPVERDREYKQFNQVVHARVTYEWLFNGRSHRWIDQNILKSNPDQSRGYLAMGILHHIGLRHNHKGFFKTTELPYAIEVLESQGQSGIVDLLKRYQATIPSD